jgi:hypothetical protein
MIDKRMEHLWNNMQLRKTEILGEKPVPAPFWTSQIPYGMTLD